jgi:hypothetical protein
MIKIFLAVVMLISGITVIAVPALLLPVGLIGSACYLGLWHLGDA